MMNFSSGNTHVIVFSLEIYFHIKNRASSATILSLQTICFRVLIYILYTFSQLFITQTSRQKP